MRNRHVILSVAKNLIIFTIAVASIVSPTYAAESTPSADIKSKLEELKKEIASKAAKLKQEVNKKLQNKAYVGKVKTKSQTSITLATKNGPKIVNINQDTEFVNNAKGKKYAQKSILEEDYLASLGDVDEIGVLTARRIILLNPPLSEVKTFLWGQVIAISDKLVTLKDKALKNVAVSLSNPSTIKVSDFVILTGFLGKNDIFESEFMYVIPQGGVLKPKKVATPSATSKTTPKPTSR